MRARLFVTLTVAPVLVGVQCAPSKTFDTAVELPSTPRHPDGVMLELSPALALPEERVAAAGVVALVPPLTERDAERLVASFFDAFVKEDIDRLTALLSSTAAPLGAHRQASANALKSLWEQRLRRFDYASLAGFDLYQTDRFEFDPLPANAEPARPIEMQPGDLLAKVHTTLPYASERMFGDVITLLLRREDGTPKIAGYFEEPAP